VSIDQKVTSRKKLWVFHALECVNETSFVLILKWLLSINSISVLGSIGVRARKSFFRDVVEMLRIAGLMGEVSNWDVADSRINRLKRSRCGTTFSL
jgi:hypothetical protein